MVKYTCLKQEVVKLYYTRLLEDTVGVCPAGPAVDLAMASLGLTSSNIREYTKVPAQAGAACHASCAWQGLYSHHNALTLLGCQIGRAFASMLLLTSSTCGVFCRCRWWVGRCRLLVVHHSTRFLQAYQQSSWHCCTHCSHCCSNSRIRALLGLKQQPLMSRYAATVLW